MAPKKQDGSDQPELPIRGMKPAEAPEGASPGGKAASERDSPAMVGATAGAVVGGQAGPLVGEEEPAGLGERQRCARPAGSTAAAAAVRLSTTPQPTAPAAQPSPIALLRAVRGLCAAGLRLWLFF